MGGKSSSKQATTTTTKVDTQNLNVADSIAVAGNRGSNNRTTIQVLDGGAIDRALDFAESGQVIQGENFMGALGFAERIVDGAGLALEDINRRSLEQVSSFANRSIEEVNRDGNERIIQAGLIAAGAVVAVTVLPKVLGRG